MPKEQRQLLLLSLPTIAVVFGLLWLRHRRGRKQGSGGGTSIQTDPGGRELNKSSLDTISPEIILSVPLENKEFRELADSDIEEVEKQLVEESHEVVLPKPVELERSEKVKKALIADLVASLTDTVSVSVQEESPSLGGETTSGVDLEVFEDVCIQKKVEDLCTETKKEINKVVECATVEKEINEAVGSSTEKEQIYKTANPTTVKEEIIVGTNLTEVENPIIKDLNCSEVKKEIFQKPSEITRKEMKKKNASKGSTKLENNSNIKKKNNTKVTPEGDTSYSGKVKKSTEKMIKEEQGELVEKLASLELDGIKIHDKDSSVPPERDSANHSPSEVMLASPSMSNFSDAHSEGSSDSGKGHSDVATSPSRTPAGGGSLAGDLALSLYEFVLPQVIVGRLIGRHGSLIQEIRTSTATNIYIKRHPDTNKLKICAIEGTQQDIEKALAKIRQKFPIRRYPQLTLDKVTFVTINKVPPLKREDFHLQLIEGVNNDVILSSLISAAHFFLQQPHHPTYGALSALNLAMNSLYSTSEAPILDSPVKDAVCVAPTMGGWYRAQIVSVNEEANKCTVKFLDYGGYLEVDSNTIKQIRGDLLNLPFQAVECCLANVAPVSSDMTWSEEACLFVHSITQGQILQAQIYSYSEDGTLPLVYLYSFFGNQVVLINEELVVRGYATLISPTTTPVETSAEPAEG